MTAATIIDLARHFPENGMKLLLQHPKNVRDLLEIKRCKLVNLIDFDRLQLDPTTYVQRDYRHLESDLVLRGPLLRSPTQRLRARRAAVSPGGHGGPFFFRAFLLGP